MKKLIFVIALIALASAVFADVSITDWTYMNGRTFWTKDAAIEDYGSAGFDFAMSEDFYANSWRSMASFVSNNVSGWVHDANDTFTVGLEGFDDLYFEDERDVDTVYVILWRNNDADAVAAYALPYTGDGDYLFGPESFARGTNRDGDIATVQIGLGTEADGGGFLPGIVNSGPEWDSARYTAETYGSIWFGDKPERPETEVPEPATYAYAAMGLVSACGIKRRSRK
ncbi:MAG: hypothetical protein IJT09_05245 [Abditibacteriota bacterium]|nr:hypothetical protein [Abditibacteriota bacterium]